MVVDKFKGATPRHLAIPDGSMMLEFPNAR